MSAGFSSRHFHFKATKIVTAVLDCVHANRGGRLSQCCQYDIRAGDATQKYRQVEPRGKFVDSYIKAMFQLQILFGIECGHRTVGEKLAVVQPVISVEGLEKVTEISIRITDASVEFRIVYLSNKSPKRYR
jgi:hypothetical protein